MTMARVAFRLAATALVGAVKSGFLTFTKRAGWASAALLVPQWIALGLAIGTTGYDATHPANLQTIERTESFIRADATRAAATRQSHSEKTERSSGGEKRAALAKTNQAHTFRSSSPDALPGDDREPFPAGHAYSARGPPDRGQRSSAAFA